MKFSENWLRSVCPTSLSTEGLSNALTMAGLEVESVEPVAKNLEGVVVGLITNTRPHPNAERLKICDVDVGLPEELQIVCGAPNASPGMKVPTALVKARLPGGLVIKKAKLRGELSQGMLCSASELEIGDDSSGLMSLDQDIVVGSDMRDVFDLNDNVFTLKLTANRGDCLSIAGIARELQAIDGTIAQHPKVDKVASLTSGKISVTVANEQACPLYLGLSIKGVNANGKTPDHILRKLERSGVRGISPIVDLTNFVMLEFGQPMHAFDQDKLNGNIVVRSGHKGETLDLLNGQSLDVAEDMLLITDESGPIALAGIMGGLSTAVDESTTSIFLEAAVFSTQSVAGKWRTLGFSTDALHRFERGVDSHGTQMALWRLANLIVEVCGGEVEALVKTGVTAPEKKIITFRPERVRRLIGMEISIARMTQIFELLDMKVSSETGYLSVTPPSYRFDLELEEDLIEEIVRIEGFEKLPSTLPVSETSMLTRSEEPSWSERLKVNLKRQGYQEVITYSFVDSSLESDFGVKHRGIVLMNPIAEQYTVMRTNLLGSLALVVQRNLSHRIDRVRIFETSLCFERDDSGEINQTNRIAGMVTGSVVPEQWGAVDREVDFFDVKGDLERMLNVTDVKFSIGQHESFHPGKVASISVDGTHVGTVGELHPELSQKYDLGENVVAFELNLDALPQSDIPDYLVYSKLPVVRRDLAVEIDLGTEVGAILSDINAENIQYLKEVTLFDVYSGKGIAEGKKSVALGVMFQDEQKTLTDEEVEKSVSLVLKLLKQRFNATQRI
jgi:phenylalanyl-tRNA synthetase beta chain